jgi:hypothetical protein
MKWPKTIIVGLAMAGFLDFAWFRSFGTWVVRVTGGAAQ